MARTHATPYGKINFTADEEKARDAEEKAELEARPAEMFKIVRRERDFKLAKTDWMTLADTPDMSDEWKAYRKSLRDLPSTLNDTTVLNPITWPKEPA